MFPLTEEGRKQAPRGDSGVTWGGEGHAHHSLPPSHDRSFPPPLCFRAFPIRNIKGTRGSSTDHLAAELGTHLHPHLIQPTQSSRPQGPLDSLIVFNLCPLPLPSGFPDFICYSRYTELTSVPELLLHSASGICRTPSHILLATAPPPVVTPLNLRTLHLSIYTTVALLCFAFTAHPSFSMPVPFG